MRLIVTKTMLYPATPAHGTPGSDLQGRGNAYHTTLQSPFQFQPQQHEQLRLQPSSKGESRLVVKGESKVRETCG